MQRFEDSNETKVEVEDTEEDPDDVASFSPSLNGTSTECISTPWDGGGEHVEVTDSSCITIFQMLNSHILFFGLLRTYYLT